MPTVDKITPIPQDDSAVSGAIPVTAQLSFDVSFLENSATAVDAANLLHASLPNPGDAHPSSTYLRAQNRQARRIGMNAIFRVTIPYRTSSYTSGGDKAIHPLSRTPRWSADPDPKTIQIDRDSAGNLIQTSAKQVLTITALHEDKYMTVDFNTATMENYDTIKSTINAGAVTLNGISYPAKSVRLSGVSQRFTEEEYDGEIVAYYTNTARFSIIIKRTTNDFGTWNQRIIDRGTQVVYGAAGSEKKRQASDVLGAVITEPVNLDGTGHGLDYGSPVNFLEGTGYSTTPTNGIQIYKTASWTTLPPLAP